MSESSTQTMVSTSSEEIPENKIPSNMDGFQEKTESATEEMEIPHATDNQTISLEIPVPNILLKIEIPENDTVPEENTKSLIFGNFLPTVEQISSLISENTNVPEEKSLEPKDEKIPTSVGDPSLSSIFEMGKTSEISENNTIPEVESLASKEELLTSVGDPSSIFLDIGKISEISEVKTHHPTITPPKSVPIEANFDVISMVLKTPDTLNWSERDYCSNTYHLVELNTCFAEFKMVTRLFAHRTFSYFPTTIKRVQNPFLLGQYLLKKAQNSQYIEKCLFHGTRILNLDNICRNNFNWRKNGSARGTKFGQGVSFAENAYYATHFTGGDRVMFLTKVLVHKSTKGSNTTSIPPNSCDTTDNDKGTVFVKYEDDDFYPEYIIYYNSKRNIDSDSDDF